MANKNQNKHDTQRKEILGFLIMAFALLVFLGLVSFHYTDYPNSGSETGIKNWLGLAGAWISYYLFVYTIGYSCLLFPFVMFLLGWTIFLQRDFKPFFRICRDLIRNPGKCCWCGFFYAVLSLLCHRPTEHKAKGTLAP